MQDRLFEQAKETLYFLSHHPEERAAYTQRLKYLLDTASRLDEAKTEGIQIGKVEGRAEGKAEGRAEGKVEGIQIGEHRKALEFAKMLKENDFPLMTIVKMTKLSPEEVENL